jgi:HPt (histidine-containing phosphotransfer) domain-containing protein
MTGVERSGDVDFKHLESYVADERALVREVLGLFSDQARTVLPKLDPAASNDDWRNAAHSLKGSALGIGAFALAKLCSEAELARDAPIDVKREHLERVAEALDQALAAIAVYLRD